MIAEWGFFWNWPQQSPHTQQIDAETQIANFLPAANAGSAVNPQAGATYTVSDADRGRLLVTTNALGAAVTLPTPSTLTEPSTFFMYAQNIGAVAATYTPTAATIDGLASITLAQFKGALIGSDGTNYFTMRG